ncbi:MAG TPA: hypothetical protein VFR02_05535 [bacterium]|nr:hypothetical protein [bacterium]
MATMKFPDKAAQAKLRKQVAQKLAQGRSKIQELEKKIRSGEAGREITAELKKAKAKLEKLKAQYKVQEKKAMDYVQKNPKKAVLAAAAVGLLAGAVLAALKSSKKK